MVDAERLGARLDRLEHPIVEPPNDYAGVFMNLARAGRLDPSLAAARQRNVLVHMYLDIDDRQVFASLGRLDDLREFAVRAQQLADEN